MSQLRLSQCLGTVSSESFRRQHNESLIESLAHRRDTTFAWARTESGGDEEDAGSGRKGLPPYIAHQAGVNCLAIDQIEGRYLVSGGADSAIRLWDLEEHVDEQSPRSPASITKYTPQATLNKALPSSHTHALTSLSIYPFDPTPSTLLSTSYDKTLKVHAITPSSLTTLHTFSLDFTPYTHSLSPLPDSPPLIAVGTAHPAIRLLDLRSGLSTHSLPGPNGAIYTLAWSPKRSHILASGSADGRVLFFDTRRANAAFASLDLDDAIGVLGTNSAGLGARPHLLDFNAVAHNGPVTSVQWTPQGDKIVTSGHDQRIRVWDATTGRNDLVHFGPRIRNDRQGEMKPLLSPRGFHAPGQERLWWPNDDGKGMLFQHHMREGHLLKILRTEGVRTSETQGGSKRGVSSSSASNLARLTSGGRINDMVWRVNARLGEGLEMYTAHGDGRICAWLPSYSTGDDEDENDAERDGKGKDGATNAPDAAEASTSPHSHPPAANPILDEAEQRRKRKREMLEDMLGGLSRQSMRFS